MQGERGEHWMQLCKQASVEQDPKKLMQLIAEINRLLQEKERRLMNLRGISARNGRSSTELPAKTSPKKSS
jgi:hypothetical protein